MSNEIDERVVQLQFDNKQFERGVEESIASLRKFNESLDAVGSGSKFEGISEAVAVVNDRLSTMGIIGGRILERLTDRAFAFGSQMLRSLNQVSAGWNRYEMTMNATRTTMNATGKSMEEVEAVFADLAEYADQTSYNLGDMQHNLSLITSSGAIRDLGKAEKTMEGIANAAAYAGIGIREASHPMSVLVQAMSEGHMSRNRWNSLQAANFTNPQLIEQFIQAGIRQGTLTKEGKIKGKNIKITQKNFEESLRYGWLTADAMTDAFGVYADHSTEGTLGSLAYAAAQEAKTFTDVLDTLKDVISTGWGTSFKLIFGNVEEAAKLFSWMAEEVSKVAGKVAEFRNELLKGWKEGGGRDSLVRSITAIWETLKKVGSLITTSLKNVFGAPTVDMLLNFSKKIETATVGIYKWLGGNNNNAGDKIVPRFVSIRNAIEGVLSVVNSLKTAAWEVVKFVGKIFGANFETFDEFLLVIGRAGRFVTNLVNAVHKAEIVPRFFTWLYNTIKPLAPILAFMMASWVMKGGLAAFFGANSGILGTIFKIIAGGLKLISVVGIAISTVTLAVAAFKFVAGIVQSIGPAFEVVKGKVVSVWNFLKALVSGISTKIGNAFSNGFSGITSKIVGAFERVKEIVVKWLNSLKTGLPSVFEDVGNKLVSWYNIIKQRIKTILDGLPSVFDSVKSTIVGWATTIKNVLPGVWSSITDFFGNLWTNVTNWINTEVPTAWESMKNAVSGFGTSIVAGVAEAFPKAWQAVQSFGERIFNGIFGEEGDKSKSGGKASNSDTTGFSSHSKYRVVGHIASASISDSDRGLKAPKQMSFFDYLSEMATYVFERAKSRFEAIWNAIVTWVAERWADISSWFATTFGGLFSTIAGWFKGEGAAKAESISDGAEDFFSRFSASISTIWQRIVSWLIGAWNSIKEFVSNFDFEKIVSFFDRAKTWISEKATIAFDTVVAWVKNTWASLKEAFSNFSGSINYTFFINAILAILPVLLLLKRITKALKAFEEIRTDRLVIMAGTLIGVIGGITAVTLVLGNSVPGMLNSLGTTLDAIASFVQKYHFAILIGIAATAISLLSIGLMRIGRVLVNAGRNFRNTFSIFNFGKDAKDDSLVSILQRIGLFMLQFAAAIGILILAVDTFVFTINKVGNMGQAVQAFILIAIFMGLVGAFIAGMSVLASQQIKVGVNNQGQDVFRVAGDSIAKALKEIGLIFVEIAALIAVVTGAMWAFTLMSPGQYWSALAYFTITGIVLTAILTTAMIIYSKFAKNDKVDVKGFSSLAAGVGALVAVFLGTYIAFSIITALGINWGALFGSIAMISVLAVVLGFAMGLAAKAGESKKAFSAFLGMAVLIGVVISSIVSLASSIGRDPVAAITSLIFSAAIIAELIYAFMLVSSALNQSDDPKKTGDAIHDVFMSLAAVMVAITLMTGVASTLDWNGVVAVGLIMAGLFACFKALPPVMDQVRQMASASDDKSLRYLKWVFGLLGAIFVAVGFASDLAKDANPFVVASMVAGVWLCLRALPAIFKAANGLDHKSLLAISLILAALGACFVLLATGVLIAKNSGADSGLVLALAGGVAAAVFAASLIVKDAGNAKFSSLAGVSLILVALGTCFTFLGHAAGIARGVDPWLVAEIATGTALVIATAYFVVSAAKDVSFTSLSGVALILAAIGGCFVALGYASQLARDTDPWLVVAMTGGMAACILAIALVVKWAKDVKFSSLAGVALIFAGLGVCIILLGEAVKLMNGVEWDAVWRTLAVMGASLIAILVIMGILKAFDSMADAAAKGAWGLIKVLGIVSIGVAVILAVVALIATVIAHLGYDALTTFGSGLEQFGGNMEQFYESTKNFTTADFQRICDCVKIIYEMIRDYIITVNFELWKTYNSLLYSFRNRMNYLYNDLVKMNPETLKNRLGMLTDIKTAVEGLDGMPDVSDDLTALGGAIALFYGNMNKTSFTDADGNEINVDSINFEGIREMFNRISQGLPDDKDIEAVGAFADNSEGTKLGRFAIGVTNLSTALDLYLKTLQSYTPDDIQTSGDILSMLQGLAEALPSDTELSAAVGDVDVRWKSTKQSISDFAGDVSDLGAALADLAGGVSDSIKVVDPKSNKTNFDVAIEVAGKINEIQQALPTRGFLSSWLMGKEDLGRFSTNIASLGRGIKNFALAIKQGKLEDSDIAQANAVTDIIKVLAEADKAVSANQAGFLANLTGNSNWDQFTKNMPKLANGLISFVNTINAPENSDVEYASDMVIGMLGVLEALSGPLSKLLSGQVTNLYGLNNDLPGLATGLVSLVRGLSGKDGGLTPEDINTANSTLEALGRLFGSTLMEAFARGLAIEVSTANQEGKQSGTLTMNLYKAATMGLTEYVISTFGEGVPQETLDAALESLSSVGFDWGFALLTGIARGMTDIKTTSENEVYAAAVTVSNTIAGYFEEQKFKKQAEDIGKNLDLGLARGVSDEKNKARPVGAFGQVILAMLARARNIAEIHSPSAVTTKYGLYLDQGLSNGITGGAGGVFGSVNGLFDGIFSSVSEWFNGLVTSVSDWFGGLADGLNLGDIGDGVISALNGDWSKVGELVGLDLGDGLLSGIDKAIFGEGGIEGAIFGEGGVMGAIKNYDFKGLLGEETGGRVNDIVGQILPTIENIDFSDPSSAAAALGQINWTSIFGEDSGIAQALGKVDWSTVVTDNLGGTLVNLLGGLDWTTLLGLDFMSEADLASYDNWNDVDWKAGLGAVNSGRTSQSDEDKDNSSNLGGSGGSGRSSDSSTFGKQTTTVSAGGLVLSATEGYTIGDILNRIDRLENAITHMQIVMDSGVLAGQLAPAMDGALGTQAILGGRWN